MIDVTAKILGPSSIGKETYIGSFCVIGFPSTNQSSYSDMLLNNSNLSSNGARIGEITPTRSPSDRLIPTVRMYRSPWYAERKVFTFSHPTARYYIAIIWVTHSD